MIPLRVSRVLFHLALTGAVIAASAYLPISSQERQEPTPPQEQAAQKPMAELPEPLVIPPQERDRPNPVRPTRQSVQKGQRLFASQCAMCHGPKGDGKGDLALLDKLPTPDFTTLEQQKKRTDGALFYIITTGHGAMPAQGDRLRPDQKWNMINFIRSLAPPTRAGTAK